MSSNHPINYISLNKKMQEAIEVVEEEGNPNNAVIIRSVRNRVIKEASKVLGEAEAKQKELKDKGKYSEKIKKLSDGIDKLVKEGK